MVETEIKARGICMLETSDKRFHSLCRGDRAEALIKEYKKLTGIKLNIYDPEAIYRERYKKQRFKWKGF